MKPCFPLAVLALLASAPLASAVTLVEIDFSGAGAVGTFNQSDSQFVTTDPALTSGILTSVSGSSGTAAAWVYDGTGSAATNTDLFTVTTFGGPSRLDVELGLAAPGQSYTITSVEVDIRAAASTPTWEFGYRKTSDNSTVLLGAQTISSQSGLDPVSTYTIDLSSENLTADDTTSSWVLGGSGKLRWLFFESDGSNNDNLQVDAIRIIGTVVPEPSSLLLALLSLPALVRRRR